MKTIKSFSRLKLLILLCMAAVVICTGSFVVYAATVTTVDVTTLSTPSGDVEHSHIYASTYDGTSHWEYCTICGTKRNIVAHSYTRTTIGTQAMCSGYVQHYDTCSCGYKKSVSYPHSPTGYLRATYPERHVHYDYCTVCGNWTTSESCHDSAGELLSCKNPGTCVDCGTIVNVNHHYIVNGVCRDCGTTFFIHQEV